jgi:hypothetical protein
LLKEVNVDVEIVDDVVEVFKSTIGEDEGEIPDEEGVESFR